MWRGSAETFRALCALHRARPTCRPVPLRRRRHRAPLRRDRRARRHPPPIRLESARVLDQHLSHRARRDAMRGIGRDLVRRVAWDRRGAATPRSPPPSWTAYVHRRGWRGVAQLRPRGPVAPAGRIQPSAGAKELRVVRLSHVWCRHRRAESVMGHVTRRPKMTPGPAASNWMTSIGGSGSEQLR